MMLLGLGEVSKARVTRSDAREVTLRAVRPQRTLLPTGQDDIVGSHYEIATDWNAKVGSGGISPNLVLSVANMRGDPWVQRLLNRS